LGMGAKGVRSPGRALKALSSAGSRRVGRKASPREPLAPEEGSSVYLVVRILLKRKREKTAKNSYTENQTKPLQPGSGGEGI